MAKYLTEFLGTFFLVLIIGLSLGSGSAQAPIAIGVGLAAMVYLGAHISGAHYNPAITLAFLINGDTHWKDAGIYFLVQLAGATLGALSAGIMIQDQDFTFLIELAGSANPVQILLAEVLFTFFLALLFLNISHNIKEMSKAYYGLAIGFMVMAGFYAVEGVSGAAFNPAIGFGPNVLHLNFFPMWYYAVGPSVGATLAAFTFRLMVKRDKDEAAK